MLADSVRALGCSGCELVSVSVYVLLCYCVCFGVGVGVGVLAWCFVMSVLALAVSRFAASRLNMVCAFPPTLGMAHKQKSGLNVIPSGLRSTPPPLASSRPLPLSPPSPLGSP